MSAVDDGRNGVAPSSAPANGVAPSAKYPDNYVFGLSWLDDMLGKHKFLVFVFYRGDFCPFCKRYMKAFGEEANSFSMDGGKLIGVCAQSPRRVAATQKDWACGYDFVSDPHLFLAKHFNIPISLQIGFKNGMCQPGVVALCNEDILQTENPPAVPAAISITRTRTLLYWWAIAPNLVSGYGAVNRVHPEYCLRKIQTAWFEKQKRDAKLQLLIAQRQLKSLRQEPHEYKEEKEEQAQGKADRKPLSVEPSHQADSVPPPPEDFCEYQPGDKDCAVCEMPSPGQRAARGDESNQEPGLPGSKGQPPLPVVGAGKVGAPPSEFFPGQGDFSVYCTCIPYWHNLKHLLCCYQCCCFSQCCRKAPAPPDPAHI